MTYDYDGNSGRCVETASCSARAKGHGSREQHPVLASVRSELKPERLRVDGFARLASAMCVHFTSHDMVAGAEAMQRDTIACIIGVNAVDRRRTRLRMRSIGVE
jgi:hypothetical protein